MLVAVRINRRKNISGEFVPCVQIVLTILISVKNLVLGLGQVCKIYSHTFALLWNTVSMRLPAQCDTWASLTSRADVYRRVLYNRRGQWDWLSCCCVSPLHTHFQQHLIRAIVLETIIHSGIVWLYAFKVTLGVLRVVSFNKQTNIGLLLLFSHWIFKGCNFFPPCSYSLLWIPLNTVK